MVLWILLRVQNWLFGLFVLIMVSCGRFWLSARLFCPHDGFMRTYPALRSPFLSSWPFHADMSSSLLALFVLMTVSCGHVQLFARLFCPHDGFMRTDPALRSPFLSSWPNYVDIFGNPLTFLVFMLTYPEIKVLKMLTSSFLFDFLRQIIISYTVVLSTRWIFAKLIGK